MLMLNILDHLMTFCNNFYIFERKRIPSGGNTENDRKT